MRDSFRNLPFRRAIVVFLLFTLAAGVSAESDTLEEIIVTAERRAVDIQDIPLSISAFDQGRLDKSDISTISGLQNITPNLQFSMAANAGTHAIVTIRGIGTEVLPAYGETGVAIYQNGIYFGRASASLADFYDVERVEVLRGPQGTLYGRNAIGGAINIINNKPREETEISASALAGNFERRRFRGILNAPLGDSVAARITATYEEADGYLKNLVPGVADSNDIDNVTVRGQLLFDISDNIEVLARGFYWNAGGVGTSATITGNYPRYALVGVIPIRPGVFGAPHLLPGAYSIVEGGALPIPDDLHEVRFDHMGSRDHTIFGGSLEFSWDTSAFNFKSTTAWIEDDSFIGRDGDGSELPLYYRNASQVSKQFSQEVTLTSHGDGPLQWIFGLYYYEEDVDDLRFINFLNVTKWAVLAGRPPFTGATVTDPNTNNTNSSAVYGQIDYAFADRLTGTLGLRYTRDEKDGGNSGRLLLDPVTNTPLRGFPQVWTYKETWKEPTGKIALRYDQSEDSMFYISYSKGFKSGGANNDFGTIFGPEKVYTLEIGGKNRLFDDRLQLNAAVFSSDYKDMQVFTVGQTTIAIDNAAKSSIQGIEISAAGLLSDNFRLDASIAYLDAQFDEFTATDPSLTAPRPPPPPEDLAGNKLPRAPNWELTLGAEFSFNLAAGRLTIRPEFHWQDEMYFNAFNRESIRQKSWHTLNLHAIYMSSDEHWSISLFGRNLGNEDYVTNMFVESTLLGAVAVANVAKPRTYGVEVAYRFNGAN